MNFYRKYYFDSKTTLLCCKCMLFVLLKSVMFNLCRIKGLNTVRVRRQLKQVLLLLSTDNADFIQTCMHAAGTDHSARCSVGKNLTN